MRGHCSTCGQPVRFFAIADPDDDTVDLVVVENLPRLGPLRRVDAATDLAVDEGHPFPGGWSRHEHERADT